MRINNSKKINKKINNKMWSLHKNEKNKKAAIDYYSYSLLFFFFLPMLLPIIMESNKLRHKTSASFSNIHKFHEKTMQSVFNLRK